MRAHLNAAVFVVAMASVASLGCFDGEPEPDEPERGPGRKIIGSNDLIPVSRDGSNIPEKYRPLLDAYGILSMGCTATHIGNGIVLTAGHCFNAGSGIVNQPCAGTTIQWGVRKDHPSSGFSNCQMILDAKQTDSIDYAIIRVSPFPSAQVGVDLQTRPTVGTILTMFSHPQLRPLEWSQLCTLNAGTGSEFNHVCDTEPGSGGAAMLRDDTLKIIGLNVGSTATTNYASYLIDTPLAAIVGGPQPDGEPPVVTLVAPTSGSTLPGNSQLAVTVDATDNVAVSDLSLHWMFNGKVISCASPVSPWSCTHTGSQYVFKAVVGTGTRAFWASASDAAGHSANTPSFTITLQ